MYLKYYYCFQRKHSNSLIQFMNNYFIIAKIDFEGIAI